MTELGGTVRTSWEQRAIDELRGLLREEVAIVPFSGTSQANRIAPLTWHLGPIQRFQFGDLRYESPSTKVVVQVESGGGQTNLVKYWPMLEGELADKWFVLVHLFKVVSPEDYIAHRKLWEFLVSRMRTHLAGQNRRWPEEWEAQLFRYGHVSAQADMAEAAAFIAASLHA